MQSSFAHEVHYPINYNNQQNGQQLIPHPIDIAIQILVSGYLLELYPFVRIKLSQIKMYLSDSSILELFGRFTNTVCTVYYSALKYIFIWEIPNIV